jgi:tRNA(fMet)-specific endonuclease VapC
VKYVLDTDHLSIVQRKQQPEFTAIQTRAGAHSPSDIKSCVVSFHEQALGGHTYLTRVRTSAELVHGYKLLSDVIATYSPSNTLPFDHLAAAIYDQLVASKIRVKTMDLRIASIVLSVGGTLVTRNLIDFSKVPTLLVEDWTR